MKRTLWAVAVVAVVLGGCARNGASVYESRRQALSVVDDFNLLLLASGLPPHLLPSGGEVTEKEAERLLAEVKLRSAGPGTSAPQLVAEALLLNVALGDKPMPRVEVNQRLKRFEGLAVLTREGFMAWALTGEPVEWVGKVEVVGGVPRARGYEVGALHAPSGRAWRQVEWVEAVRVAEAVTQGAAPAR